MPTDPRMEELEDEQIDVLFLYHVMRPTDDQLREFYRQEIQTEVVQETLPEDLLKARGWSAEQIARVRAELPLAAGGRK